MVEAEVKGQGPNDGSTAASDMTPNKTDIPATVESADEGCSKQRSIIPKLTLPLIQLSTEDDENEEESGNPSEVKGQSSKAEEDLEEVKPRSSSRGRRRRKSLVNILFAAKGSGGESADACTPTIEAPQGQRLHFRRVSEVFSLGVGLGRRDSKDVKSECVSPAVTPADCTGGLSIRNLFPYRHGMVELELGQEMQYPVSGPLG